MARMDSVDQPEPSPAVRFKIDLIVKRLSDEQQQRLRDYTRNEPREPIGCAMLSLADQHPTWGNFRVMLFGFPIEDREAAGTPPVPILRFVDEQGGSLEPWALPLQLAYRPGSPVLSELQWHPTIGLSRRITHLPPTATKEQAIDGWRELKLLEYTPERLPRGPRPAGAEDKLQRVTEAAEALITRGEEISARNLAPELNVSEDRVSGLLQETAVKNLGGLKAYLGISSNSNN